MVGSLFASVMGLRYEVMTAPFDLSQTDLLLSTTRAVRKRLDLTREVPIDVVMDCIRLATQAPAGGNVQKWRWMIVTDAAKRAAIAELYRRAYAPYIDAQRKSVAETGRTGVSAIMSSSDYLAEHLAEVPMFVIPCGLDRVPPNASNMAMTGYYGSLLPAAWSFQLALRSRGLGSAWTTLHLVYEREAGEILGIPDTVTQLALLPVAYTLGTDFKPGARRPAEEVTYLDTWKNPAV
jgi:nitroreductase